MGQKSEIQTFFCKPIVYLLDIYCFLDRIVAKCPPVSCYTIRMAEKTLELEKRAEHKNRQTINRLLNLYDLMLQEYTELIQNIGQESDPDIKADILTEFKALVTMADPLMKRWNIVHKGYDTNARIAESDAKAKAEKRAKKASESDPNKKDVVTVAHWDREMQIIQMELPMEMPDNKKQGP